MNNVIKHCGSAGERQTRDALNTADLDATKVTADLSGYWGVRQERSHDNPNAKDDVNGWIPLQSCSGDSSNADK